MGAVQSWAYIWKHHSLDSLSREAVAVQLVEAAAERVVIRCKCDLRTPKGRTRAKHELLVTVSADGSVALDTTAKVTRASGMPLCAPEFSLPRIGLRFAAAPDLPRLGARGESVGEPRAFDSTGARPARLGALARPGAARELPRPGGRRAVRHAQRDVRRALHAVRRPVRVRPPRRHDLAGAVCARRARARRLERGAVRVVGAAARRAGDRRGGPPLRPRAGGARDALRRPPHDGRRR